MKYISESKISGSEDQAYRRSLTKGAVMAIVGAAALGTSSARGQADDGKKFVIVRTIGELKTTGVSSTVQLVALVLGYSSVNDGGEGFFVWDPFNAQPANGGTVFASTASPTGRWLRLSV